MGLLYHVVYIARCLNASPALHVRTYTRLQSCLSLWYLVSLPALWTPRPAIEHSCASSSRLLRRGPMTKHTGVYVHL